MQGGLIQTDPLPTGGIMRFAAGIIVGCFISIAGMAEAGILTHAAVYEAGKYNGKKDCTCPQQQPR